MIGRRTATRLVGLLGLLLTAAVLLAGPAAAHATLVTSTPADGARLASAPSQVSITFDEAISIGYLHVTDQTGRRVESGVASHPNGDATTIVVALKAGLGDGSYTESYRIISADSHPVAGVVRFVVGNGVLSAAPGTVATVNRLTSLVFDVARWLSYLGFAVFGGTWLLLTVWPAGRDDRRARRIVWAGWTATVVGAVAELVIQGPYSAGVGLSHLASGTLLDDTLHTDYGQAHCARLLALGAAALVLSVMLQRIRRYDAVALVFGPVIAWTFSLTGHPRTTAPTWLSVTLDVAHLTAMAAWVGGLVLIALALLPRHEPDEDAAALPVFSRVAMTAVATLAVTGTWAAWKGIGSLHAILATTYGRLVTIKVLLFLGLLGLGYVSRRAVQRRFAEQLRRAVLVELVLVLGALVATSVLVAEPRGSEALAVTYLKPVSGSAELGSGSSVDVTADPGRHGNVTVTVTVVGGTTPQSVTATATDAARQIGPIPVALTKQSNGVFAGSGTGLPVAGHWRFDLVVTRSEFDATTVSVTLTLH